MRLAVFTNQFPGLVSTFFARDVRGLIDAGVDIDVFAIYPYDPAMWRYVPSMLDDTILPRSRIHHLTNGECLRGLRSWSFAKTVGFLRDTLAIEGSAIRYGIKPLVKSAYVALKAWRWAQQFGGEFDHVLAYWGNYTGTCAYLFHRLCARSMPFSLFLHAGMDLYRQPIYMRQKLLYADNIVVVCEFNKHFLQREYKDIYAVISNKIYVHHLGLDVENIPYLLGSRAARSVIAVGRIEEKKGFQYILWATHELKRRGVDVEVELIGDGSYVGFLKRLVDTLGISDRVTFRGWLTFNEVLEAMKKATVLAHASPDIGDAVPTVIKEAMAVGTPVIATKVAGIPELLDGGGCGVLVPPKDVSALADAIERLLGDTELRVGYAAAARKHVETKFNMQENGENLAKLLSSTTRHFTCLSPS